MLMESVTKNLSMKRCLEDSKILLYMYKEFEMKDEENTNLFSSCNHIRF